MSKKRVCIIGSGNWGSAIAKILGNNVKHKCDEFETTINMYMYEEMIDGRKLTEIVNTEHENVKYLPGIKLPDNVVAIPDLMKATAGADILIFVLPHQFLKKICEQIKGNMKNDAIGVSLIKGFVLTGEGITLISKTISEDLGIPCSVVMGANLAQEVAEEQFCETTIGCIDNQTGAMLKDLFETDYFLCAVVEDVSTVEVCGALKNVVAIGSGIVDGLGFGDNTKAAVIRLGLMEMVKFAKIFFPGAHMSTFFESCGISDLVATCRGGRNRRLGEAVVRSNKSILELEEEILKGQSFQGPLIAHEVNAMLKSKDMVDRFPLFEAVNRICERELDPKEFITCLKAKSSKHLKEIPSASDLNPTC